jgi:hypothetical protein
MKINLYRKTHTDLQYDLGAKIRKYHRADSPLIIKWLYYTPAQQFM